MSGTTGAPASQTLSRGIRILEVLADAREPLTIDQLADRLSVHRSIAYRLLRTLEDHGLVTRDAGGRVALGARMAALAAGVAHDLQAEALPELTAAANDLGMTCFLSLLDHDECVTLVSVEPRHAVASVASGRARGIRSESAHRARRSGRCCRSLRGRRTSTTHVARSCGSRASAGGRPVTTR